MKTLLGIGCLIVALATTAPAAADFPGHNGRILFTTPNRPDLPPSCGVASVSAAGTGYECVDPVGFDPSATPNHRLIAEVRPGNPAQVYTVTLTGTGARRLTNTSDA